MLNYQKITTPCLNMVQLAEELRAFCAAHTTFTDAGNIGQNPQTFTLKSPENFCYNFDFKLNEIETYISRTKPTNEFYDKLIPLNTAQKSLYSLTRTQNFKYPIQTRHFFTNGRLVVMVLEIASGVFRHHAFGKMDTFGNIDGGEFCGGTHTSTYGGSIQAQYVGGMDYINLYYYSMPFIQGINSSYGGGNYRCMSHIRLQERYIFVNANSIYTTSETECCFARNTPFYGLGANHYNGRAAIYPIVWGVAKPNTPNWSEAKINTPVFYTDLVALVDIGAFQPEDILNNEWVVFPLVSKSTDLQNDVSTTNYGVAYKIKV